MCIFVPVTLMMRVKLLVAQRLNEKAVQFQRVSVLLYNQGASGTNVASDPNLELSSKCSWVELRLRPFVIGPQTGLFYQPFVIDEYEAFVK